METLYGSRVFSKRASVVIDVVITRSVAGVTLTLGKFARIFQSLIFHERLIGVLRKRPVLPASVRTGTFLLFYMWPE